MKPPIIRESFALFFGGGKIFGVELDGLTDHRMLVLEKFHKDVITLQKPSTPSQIAVHLKDTQTDPEMARIMLEQLNAPMMHLQKVAVVGLPFLAKHSWQRLLREMHPPTHFACAFFEDYEKAKEWLVQ